uniref:Uncharacterized protein n=1 Tax=Oryza brachyantha TaxID=4533 RepID=J3LBS6_ORYBR
MGFSGHKNQMIRRPRRALTSAKRMEEPFFSQPLHLEMQLGYPTGYSSWKGRSFTVTGVGERTKKKTQSEKDEIQAVDEQPEWSEEAREKKGNKLRGIIPAKNLQHAEIAKNREEEKRRAACHAAGRCGAVDGGGSRARKESVTGKTKEEEEVVVVGIPRVAAACGEWRWGAEEASPGDNATAPSPPPPPSNS